MQSKNKKEKVSIIILGKIYIKFNKNISGVKSQQQLCERENVFSDFCRLLRICDYVNKLR